MQMEWWQYVHNWLGMPILSGQFYTEPRRRLWITCRVREQIDELVPLSRGWGG